MSLLRNIWTFAISLFHWLSEGWRVFVPMLLTTSVLVVASLLSQGVAELLLRYCGLAFQVLGILTVVVGLREKLHLFNRPGFTGEIRRWIERRPRWRPRTQTIIVTGIGGVTMTGGATVSAHGTVSPASSLEIRVAALEAGITALREDLVETKRALDDSISQVKETVGVERRERRAVVKALRVQLEGLGAGGVNIEVMGVMWLLAGVVLATVPDGIVRLLK
jgi:hypothetical protein